MGDWPHPPAVPEKQGLLPQPVFLLRAVGLAGLAAATTAAAVALWRVSAWLLPAAVVLGLTALLAIWGAAVQFVGSEKVDDHPWV